MPIIEPVIRPPSEADSFLLQVTLGCSLDTCTFCGAYKSKHFRVKDPKEISRDIAWYAKRYPQTRRVFLMDGDALVLKSEKLIPILDELILAFPKLTRVSSYANGLNIIKKSDEELLDLSERKLSLVYMGLESGSQKVLTLCQKRSTVTEMIDAVNRLTKANIKSSVIVLLGLGGKKHSKEHAVATIEVLNKMQPRYLSFLSVMVIPGTPLAQALKKGEFEELTPQELLQESFDIIKGLELTKTIFRSNHASNHLALEGVFPKDKSKLLALLEAAIKGKIVLRPEMLRGL